MLQSTSDYDVLDVPQGASQDDIKKKYKKLARDLHPDKNRAPQSDEAFKGIVSYYHR